MTAERDRTLILGLLALILGNLTDGWMAGVWFVLSLILAATYFAMRWLDWRRPEPAPKTVYVNVSADASKFDDAMRRARGATEGDCRAGCTEHATCV